MAFSIQALSHRHKALHQEFVPILGLDLPLQPDMAIRRLHRWCNRRIRRYSTGNGVRPVGEITT